jgi:hypothetical protein
MKCAILVVIVGAVLLPACDDSRQVTTSPERVVATPPVPPAPVPIPTRPPTPVPEANGAPTLRISINPDEPGGALPREVTVNMCGSTDPEGERIVYEYKWGGGAQHFSYFCRMSHTYEQPGRFRAIFCAHDEHDNASCVNRLIDITG